MHNVHISDNTIVNCKTAAIGVQYCKHARVENNSIQNPMAAGLQTAWGKAKNYDDPAAILCNAVADVTIAGNRITLADPQLVPEVAFSLFLMDSRADLRSHWGRSEESPPKRLKFLGSSRCVSLMQQQQVKCCWFKYSR